MGPKPTPNCVRASRRGAECGFSMVRARFVCAGSGYFRVAFGLWSGAICQQKPTLALERPGEPGLGERGRRPNLESQAFLTRAFLPLVFHSLHPHVSTESFAIMGLSSPAPSSAWFYGIIQRPSKANGQKNSLQEADSAEPQFLHFYVGVVIPVWSMVRQERMWVLFQ